MALLERLISTAGRLAGASRQLVPDALILAGAGAIAYGAWLVYPPLGFVVGGGLSMAAGVLAARGGVA